MSYSNIVSLWGNEADSLLYNIIPKESFLQKISNFKNDFYAVSNRNSIAWNDNLRSILIEKTSVFFELNFKN